MAPLDWYTGEKYTILITNCHLQMWWPLATVEAIIRCIISERLFLLHPNDSLVVGLLLYHNVCVRHYFPPSVNVCCLHFVITFPIDWYPLIKCISIRRLRPGCGQLMEGPGAALPCNSCSLVNTSSDIHHVFTTYQLELETNLREVWSFTIKEKAPTRAFSRSGWLA